MTIAADGLMLADSCGTPGGMFNLDGNVLSPVPDLAAVTARLRVASTAMQTKYKPSCVPHDAARLGYLGKNLDLVERRGLTRSSNETGLDFASHRHKPLSRRSHQ